MIPDRVDLNGTGLPHAYFSPLRNTAYDEFKEQIHISQKHLIWTISHRCKVKYIHQLSMT